MGDRVAIDQEFLQLTSAIRRMFSSRSLGENPRSLFNPKRTLSPSNRYVARPKCRRCCSNAVAMVDLPEADRPVNQTVAPFCLRSSLRSWRVKPACHVMLLCFLHQRSWTVAKHRLWSLCYFRTCELGDIRTWPFSDLCLYRV
jgi:hypothetical protein